MTNLTLAEMDNELVSKQGWTRSELTEAFDKVQNPVDWKGRVCGLIPKEAEEITREAIAFFTATEMRIIASDDTQIVIEADGYRAGPAW